MTLYEMLTGPLDENERVILFNARNPSMLIACDSVFHIYIEYKDREIRVNPNWARCMYQGQHNIINTPGLRTIQ